MRLTCGPEAPLARALVRRAWRPPRLPQPRGQASSGAQGAASQVGVRGGSRRRGSRGFPQAPCKFAPSLRAAAWGGRRGGQRHSRGRGLARGAGAAAWPAAAGPGSGSRCGISCPAPAPLLPPPPGCALRFRPLSQQPPRPPRPRLPRAAWRGRRAPGARPARRQGWGPSLLLLLLWLLPGPAPGAPETEPARPQRVPRTRVGAGRAGEGRRGRRGPGQEGRRGPPCAGRPGPSGGPPRRRLGSRPSPSPGAGPRRCVEGTSGEGGGHPERREERGEDFRPFGRVGRAVRRREEHSEARGRGMCQGPGSVARPGGRRPRGAAGIRAGGARRSPGEWEHRLAFLGRADVGGKRVVPEQGRRGACAPSGRSQGQDKGRRRPQEDADPPGGMQVPRNRLGSPCGPGEDRTCGGGNQGPGPRTEDQNAGQKPGVRRVGGPGWPVAQPLRSGHLPPRGREPACAGALARAGGRRAGVWRRPQAGSRGALVRGPGRLRPGAGDSPQTRGCEGPRRVSSSHPEARRPLPLPAPPPGAGPPGPPSALSTPCLPGPPGLPGPGMWRRRRRAGTCLEGGRDRPAGLCLASALLPRGGPYREDARPAGRISPTTWTPAVRAARSSCREPGLGFSDPQASASEWPRAHRLSSSG